MNSQGAIREPLTGDGTGQSRQADEPLDTNLAREQGPMIDRLPCIVYRCLPDARRTVSYVSAGCRVLTGHAATEFMDGAVSLSDVVYVADRDVIEQSIQRKLVRQEPFELNYRIQRIDGEIRWVWEQGCGEFDASGVPLQVEGLITDITGHEQMGHCRRLLASIVEHCEDAICSIGLNGRIQNWNRAAERISGLKSYEAVGRHFSELAHANCRAEVKQLEVNSTRGELVERFETVLCRSDGCPVEVAVTMSPLRDAAGTLVGSSAIIRDITIEKRAEQSLLKSQQQLRQVIDLVPHSIFAKDINGTFLMANKATADLLGSCVEHIVGKRHSEFKQPQDELEAMLADDREVISSGQTKVIPEERFTDSAGRVRVLQVCKIPFSELISERPAVLGVATDITELKDAQARLIQSTRLAAMGQLLAAIAHESRGALQRIQAGVDILRLELQANPDGSADLAAIESAGDTLQRLFEELRTYAGPLKLQRSFADIATCWRKAWDDLSLLRSQRDAQLSEVLNGVDLALPIDHFRIQQVFRNLIDNSLTACTDPVRITIKVEEAILADSTGVCIAYSDNGPGIRTADRDRIFEPFYTTRSQGTGLGMPIAKRVVEAHGGTIRLVDKEHSGAGFELILPRAFHEQSTENCDSR